MMEDGFSARGQEPGAGVAGPRRRGLLARRRPPLALVHARRRRGAPRSAPGCRSWSPARRAPYARARLRPARSQLRRARRRAGRHRDPRRAARRRPLRSRTPTSTIAAASPCSASEARERLLGAQGGVGSLIRIGGQPFQRDRHPRGASARSSARDGDAIDEQIWIPLTTHFSLWPDRLGRRRTVRRLDPRAGGATARVLDATEIEVRAILAGRLGVPPDDKEAMRSS